ncbi:hypothetical protein CR513_07215, partial [Mucuna pruriens]
MSIESLAIQRTYSTSIEKLIVQRIYTTTIEGLNVQRCTQGSNEELNVHRSDDHPKRDILSKEQSKLLAVKVKANYNYYNYQNCMDSWNVNSTSHNDRRGRATVFHRSWPGYTLIWWNEISVNIRGMRRAFIESWNDIK